MNIRSILIAAWSIAVVAACAAGAAAPVTAPAAPGADEAARQYDALVKAYLAEKWDDVAKAQKLLAGRADALTAEQRDGAAYIQKAVGEHRQGWWADCKAAKKGPLRVHYWDETFSVSYAPSDKMGYRYGVAGQSLECLVYWDPKIMDSDEPTGGSLGGRGFSKGISAELNIWQALIGSHVMSGVAVWELKDYFDIQSGDGQVQQADPKKKLRFQQYHSFTTELGTLYHVGPVARQASIVWCLAPYKLEDAPHLRPRRAIAAMIVATFLADTTKWPSLELPAAAAGDTEASTAKFYHFGLGTPWTLAEDRALRAAAMRFHKANPKKQVLQQGKVVLPNELAFLMDSDADAEHQTRRNAWVKQQLAKARAARKQAQ